MARASTQSVGLCLTVFAMCAVAGAAAQQWQAPAFCKDLECPKYQLVKKIGDDIELRRYEPASWVTTSADRGSSGSFMTLFNYIQGSNAAQERISMTAPVVNKVDATRGTTTVSFYNPTKYQGGKQQAPQPTDKGVFLSQTPGMEVYVLSYGGWSNDSTAKAKAAELMKKLEAAGEKYDASNWFTAGYDSPMTLGGRHNEVWIPKAGAAAKPTAAAATAKPAAAGRRLLF